MENNNKSKTQKTTSDETANNQQIVSLNISINTTEAKLKETLTLLGFNAPLPPLTEVDQINLQITIAPEVS